MKKVNPRPMPIVRKVLLSLSLVLSLLGMSIYPLTAAAIGLNQNALVKGDMVTLGDVFTGLPQDEDKVLGPAPLPGKQMTLNAHTLLRIAVALDLPWRPQSTADFVTLKRDASLVDTDAITGILKAALQAHGIPGSFRLTLDDPQAHIILPAGTAQSAEILTLNAPDNSNMFEAELAAPSRSNPVSTLHVSGRIERLARLPVLRESLNNGDVIGARDIDYIDVPQSDLAGNAITKAEDLIGMTPRQILVSGRPINSNQIQAPLMVSRGDIVTLVFNQGGLQLTAQGKALENGARGESVRVANLSSSKTIIGQVSNNKEITLNAF